MTDRNMSPASGRQFRKNGDVVWTEDLGDKAGRGAMNGIFGEALTSDRVDYIAIQFQYNIAPMDVTVSTENGGSATQENSQAVLSTGTSENASVVMESVRKMRYRPGHDAVIYFTADFTPGIAGTYQRAGIFGTENGYYLGFEGEDFTVSLRNEAELEDLHIPQSEFNLDALDGTGESGFILHPHFLNIYRINYGWLGIAPIVFEVYGGIRKGWIPFHAIDLANQISAVHSGNPVLPIRVELGNGITEQDVVFRTGSMNASLAYSGHDEAINRYFSTGNEKSVGTALTNIFTILNPTTFQGKINRVYLRMQFMSVLTEGAQPEIGRASCRERV